MRVREREERETERETGRERERERETNRQTETLQMQHWFAPLLCAHVRALAHNVNMRTYISNHTYNTYVTHVAKALSPGPRSVETA